MGLRYMYDGERKIYKLHNLTQENVSTVDTIEHHKNLDSKGNLHNYSNAKKSDTVN